jgi:hypothetical protein
MSSAELYEIFLEGSFKNDINSHLEDIFFLAEIKDI